MKFFYLRDKKNHPVACVASFVHNGDIYYGVSTHNPIDVFSKHEARVHAVMNGLKGPNGRVHLQKGVKPIVVEQIANNPDVPKRAKEAARLWLETHYQNSLEESRNELLETIPNLIESLKLAGFAAYEYKGGNWKGVA